jgi:polyhydroxyalkanoate synthesis repressor PhaR
VKTEEFPLARGGKGQQSGGDPGKITIKKYANRRLYNTAKSSYVTLDDLSKMVRAGEDFAVYDAKSGEDITHAVLTQIIFEEEAKGQNMLPTNFLRQLIRLYGDTLQAVVPSYLDASMEAFAANQERMRKSFAQNPALQNFEALTRNNMELFEQAMRVFSPFARGRGDEAGRGEEGGASTGGEDAAGGGAAGRPAPANEELTELRAQLSEMQAQIEKLSRGKDQD